MSQEELELISRPGVGIVAIGSMVAEHIERRGFTKDFKRVIHYSGQAATARKAAILGREAEFEAFKNTVSLGGVLREAEAVLVDAHLPSEYRAATLSRLSKSNLSESRGQLIFHYKTAFESMRRDHAKQGGAGRAGMVDAVRRP